MMNQKEFVWLPVLIGGLIVAVLSGVYLWQKWKMTTPAIATNPSKYDIAELGLQFTLPASLSDLTYTVVKLSGNQAVNSIAFSSKRLEAAGCAPESAPLGYLTYDSNKDGVLITYARNSNLYYLRPNGQCKAGTLLQNWQALRDALSSLVTNYASPTQPTAPLKDFSASPTSVWKTYTNTQYGFQLEYPDGSKLPDHVYGPNDDAIRFQPIGAKQNAPDSFVVNVMSVGTPSCSVQAAMASTPLTHAVINNIDFTKYDVIQQYSNIRFTEYCTIKNNLEYLISMVPPGNIDVSKDPVLNRVISSFQFTGGSQSTSEFYRQIALKDVLSLANSDDRNAVVSGTIIGKISDGYDSSLLLTDNEGNYIQIGCPRAWGDICQEILPPLKLGAPVTIKGFAGSISTHAVPDSTAEMQYNVSFTLPDQIGRVDVSPEVSDPVTTSR